MGRGKGELWESIGIQLSAQIGISFPCYIESSDWQVLGFYLDLISVLSPKNSIPKLASCGINHFQLFSIFSTAKCSLQQHQ